MSQVKRGISPLSLFKQGKLIIFGVLLAIICFAVGFFSGGRQEKAPVLSSITVENHQPAGHRALLLHQHGAV